jgi:predicted transcriptional regulator
MKIPGFTLLGFKRPREVVCETLGKLERRVMEEAWRRKEVSVREIFISFGEHFAYTTVMTTLDRLHKKGLLTRRKSGRAFLYTARVSRAEMEQGVARDVIEGLLGSDSANGVEPVLACIVDAVSERDRELLDELDRLVKEKRRELRRLD